LRAIRPGRRAGARRAALRRTTMTTTNFRFAVSSQTLQPALEELTQNAQRALHEAQRSIGATTKALVTDARDAMTAPGEPTQDVSAMFAKSDALFKRANEAGQLTGLFAALVRGLGTAEASSAKISEWSASTRTDLLQRIPTIRAMVANAGEGAA